VARNPRSAQGAEQNGLVVGLELRHLPGRDGRTGPEIAVCTEIPLDELERESIGPGQGLENLDGLAYDLHAAAVPGDHSNPWHGAEYSGRAGRCARSGVTGHGSGP